MVRPYGISNQLRYLWNSLKSIYMVSIRVQFYGRCHLFSPISRKSKHLLTKDKGGKSVIGPCQPSDGSV
jgi:hypothetical protein